MCIKNIHVKGGRRGRIKTVPVRSTLWEKEKNPCSKRAETSSRITAHGFKAAMKINGR